MRQEQVRKRARRREATQDEQASPPGAQGSGEDCTATCDGVLAAIDALLAEA